MNWNLKKASVDELFDLWEQLYDICQEKENCKCVLESIIETVKRDIEELKVDEGYEVMNGSSKKITERMF